MSVISLGTAVIHGIGEDVLTAELTQENEKSATAEEEVIREGVNNSTETVLISDRAVELRVSGVAKTTDVAALQVGGVIVINTVNYRIIEPQFTRSGQAARFSLRVRKEDSMTYTA